MTIVPVYWCVLNLNGPKIKPLIAFVKKQLKHGSFTADLYVIAIYRLCIYNMLLIMSYIKREDERFRKKSFDIV